MKARVLTPFTMGSANYKADQVIDLPEEKILRLIGQGLVEGMRDDVAPQKIEVAPVAPAPSVPVTPAPAAAVAKPVSDKKTHKKKR